MTSKAALKSIKACIDGNDFTAAAERAAALLKDDPKNYTALLFLGFARAKLNQNDEAEKTYNLALNIKPQDPQALKGLISLYENLGSSKLDQYHETVARLAQLYANDDDQEQCQNVIDRYEGLAKKNGSRAQYRHALELLLPSSTLYHTLEGRIPHPSHTYAKILESAEAEEKEWVNNQIGERRTRLGAKIDQVTQQVRSEAISKFRVEDIYTALINWTSDDDERHRLEEQLLQRAYKDLISLPPNSKVLQRDKVLSIANGMVIIRHAFAFAWKIALDWVDAESLEDWDIGIFRAFLELFPEDGLSKVLRGFLATDVASDSDRTPPAEEELSESESNGRLSEADRLILMSEGIEDCSESLLANRILSETYLRLEEYQSAATSARKTQKLHLDAIRNFGLDLQNSLDAVHICLANALIFDQSPRYHPEAKSLFGEILQRKPLLTAPLLGIGLILEEDEDYADAVTFFQRAAERDERNPRIRLELAWCRALNGSLADGLHELQDLHQLVKEQKPPNLSMQAEILYRIAYCKWHLDPSPLARKQKAGPYQDLIASVKANASYAPAYTLLGLYFQDYGKSKQRARVAFQKAFELSTSELLAAERLAKMFADTGEWDLVELVAQRVVDSGKARPAPGSKKKASSWPFAALGVVKLNKQQYSESIVSFQAALRISPQDYHSWVGLGESYQNSGRYIAAARTFAKAESLEHGLPVDQTWFAKYMLSNVHREVGAFDEAISGYEAVLEITADELGVMIALLQTLAESAWAKVELGMFGEATSLAVRALRTAKGITDIRTDVFNLWKAVADSFSVLATTINESVNFQLNDLFSILDVHLADDELSALSTLDKVNRNSLVTHQQERTSSNKTLCLLSAILASKRAVWASSSDVHAQASSWFNLGWAEYQAYFYQSSLLQMKESKPRNFLKASMRCFKRAIELEAGNSEYWNALGVATMILNPKISQHSFVRSLHLNEHSARTWTNLGTLYLLNGGYQHANEAFTRAQSADPEYSYAWIGQGILALLYGNFREARGLFTHAFEISTSASVPSKRLYTITAFDHLVRDIFASNDVINILQPLFALRQLAVQSPSDQPFIHMLALFAERMESFEDSIATLMRSLTGMSGEDCKHSGHEKLRYLQASADIARAYLASEEYQKAVEHANIALGGAIADDMDSASSKIHEKLRLSAHITAGLAHFYLKNFDDAVSLFETAREESNDAPDIVCMLAQVHWVQSGDGLESAAELLFASVEKHPEHVPSVILLAVIGLLTNDDDILEAVEDDLKALRINDKVTVKDRMKISRVLGNLLTCKKGDPEDQDDEAETDLAAIADATKSVMLAPGQPQGWTELREATSDLFPADMALRTATKQIPPGGTLTAEDFAVTLANTGRRRDALQAIVVAPWRKEGYASLVETL